jgi:hypothetical protein
MTAANAAYMPKMTAYLSSVNANSNFDRFILIYVGDEPLPEIDNVEVFRLPHSVIRAWNVNACVQHGDWLNAEGLEVSDTDTVVFTDGDMYLQRGMNDNERNALEGLQVGEVMVGANQFKGQTLLQEASNLGFTGRQIDGFNEQAIWQLPVYNTGCIAARVVTLKALYQHYVEVWQLFSGIFQHYAKQQWLLSYLMHKYGYKVKNMKYSFHLHNHGADMPSGSRWDVRRNALTFDGEVVLLRHFTHNGAKYPL